MSIEGYVRCIVDMFGRKSKNPKGVSVDVKKGDPYLRMNGRTTLPDGTIRVSKVICKWKDGRRRVSTHYLYPGTNKPYFMRTDDLTKSEIEEMKK